MPVILGYFTVFPDDAGEPVAYADVYGLGGSVPMPAPEAEPEPEPAPLAGCAPATDAG